MKGKAGDNDNGMGQNNASNMDSLEIQNPEAVLEDGVQVETQFFFINFDEVEYLSKATGCTYFQCRDYLMQKQVILDKKGLMGGEGDVIGGEMAGNVMDFITQETGIAKQMVQELAYYENEFRKTSS